MSETPEEFIARVAEIDRQRAAEEREQAARHILYMHGDEKRGYRPGSFTEKLIELWMHADASNSTKLQGAFPVLGEGLFIAKTIGSDAVAEWGGIK